MDWTALPVPGVPITFISVDGNPPDFGDAVLTVAERDSWLIPQLDAATAAGQLIVVTSHYALGSLAMEDGSSVGDLLMAYPNVILTASTTDWPGQGRLIEIVDNGDGTLSILTTLFDYMAPEGSMAARARVLNRIAPFHSGT